jgi:hypothetical protein
LAISGIVAKPSIPLFEQEQIAFPDPKPHSFSHPSTANFQQIGPFADGRLLEGA